MGPLDTINYFDRVGGAMPGRDTFLRLYMAPGMAHCQGGEGPNSFGQAPDKPVGDAQRDLLVALDQWSEGGPAPSAIIASRRDAPVVWLRRGRSVPIRRKPSIKAAMRKMKRVFAA